MFGQIVRALLVAAASELGRQSVRSQYFKQRERERKSFYKGRS